MDDPQVFAEDRHVLAEVEPVREFVPGALPRLYLFRWRRCQQPVGQGSLPDAGAGRAQQLEHRPRSEQVEVVGVEVLLRREVRALSAATGPLVIEACEAMVVDRDGTQRAVAGVFQTLQPIPEPKEQQEWREQPGGGNQLTAERGVAHRRGGEDYRRAQVSQSAVLPFDGLQARPTRGKAARIFISRRFFGHHESGSEGGRRC